MGASAENGLDRGLYYYGARWYDPTLGRFIQPDTIVPERGDPQGLNRYSYVNNNPVKYTDPSGHWAETLWDIANIVWDIHEVRRNPRSLANWGALALDVGAAVVPLVPGGVGMLVRGGKAVQRADKAADLIQHVDEVVEGIKEIGRVEQSLQALEESAPIIIGENMSRVEAYAKKVGGKTINDFLPPEGWSEAFNRQWIQQMIEEGRTILDVGPDFRRRFSRFIEGVRPDSPFYNLERKALQGYEKYMRVFERFSKFQGGVRGLPHEPFIR